MIQEVISHGGNLITLRLGEPDPMKLVKSIRPSLEVKKIQIILKEVFHPLGGVPITIHNQIRNTEGIEIKTRIKKSRHQGYRNF